MSKKSEVIKNESEIRIELSRALKLNLEEHFNEARRIIKRLEEK